MLKSLTAGAALKRFVWPSIVVAVASTMVIASANWISTLPAEASDPPADGSVAAVLEENFDRPGGDYKRIDAPFSKPDDCRRLCLQDAGRCKSWTFARAGTRGNTEVCFLKESVPVAQPDTCCVSGRMQPPDIYTPSPTPDAPPESAPPPRQVMPTGNPQAPSPDDSINFYGAIGTKYAALGGPTGFLGPPVEIQSDAPYGGICRLYRNGMICFHQEIGEAFGVWGMIFAKWSAIGKLGFGYPVTDERPTPDGRGRYNHFRGMQFPDRPEGSIYWTPQTGAHAIYGAIRDAWAKQGWERGPLGFPMSDEFQDGKYRRVNFERGYIRWAPDSGIETGR